MRMECRKVHDQEPEPATTDAEEEVDVLEDTDIHTQSTG